MRKLWGALLAASALALMPAAVTHARFTDRGTVVANGFSTGTIDLVSSPASALVSTSGMAPGDAVTAPVTLLNGGTSALRYALSTTVSGDPALADGLRLAIKAGVADCSASGFASSGTELYSGSLAVGALGDAAQGADPGDRTLNPSGSEELCFQVRLPGSAGNELRRRAASATFTFDAEQNGN